MNIKCKYLVAMMYRSASISKCSVPSPGSNTITKQLALNACFKHSHVEIAQKSRHVKFHSFKMISGLSNSVYGCIWYSLNMFEHVWTYFCSESHRRQAALVIFQNSHFNCWLAHFTAEFQVLSQAVASHLRDNKGGTVTDLYWSVIYHPLFHQGTISLFHTHHHHISQAVDHHL